MFPVAQLNLREAPYVASVVDDIALITLFFSEPVLTEEGENGGNWELRSYRDLELLIRLDVELSRARERFPKVVWEPAVAGYSLLRSDYPDVYDIPSDLAIPELVLDQWSSRVVPCKSPKIGGWPFLLQGPLEWTVEVERQPEFAFQLTSFGNRKFPFWDIAYYVGRVRGRRPSEWVLTSQST
jgi:hypothetical protein